MLEVCLFSAEFLCHVHDVGSAEAELGQQFLGGAGVAKFIVDTDAAQGGGVLLTEQGSHRFAQTADDGMLLAGDDLAALFRSGQNQRSSRGLMVAMLMTMALIPDSARVSAAVRAS